MSSDLEAATGDNDFDKAIPAASIPEDLFTYLHLCALAGTSPLGGDLTMRSSDNILAHVSADPGQYNIPNIVFATVEGSIASAAAAPVVAAALGAIAAAPLVVVAGVFLAAFSSDNRAVKMIILNGLDQDLVREGPSVMTHGMQTGHPELQMVDIDTGALLKTRGNVIPAARDMMVPVPGKGMQKKRYYGMGIYQFEKSQMALAGKSIPVGLYGVEGGISFGTKDGSARNLALSFMVPEIGDNAYAVSAGLSGYQSLSQFVDLTVSSGKTKNQDHNDTVNIQSSLWFANFPDKVSDTNKVMTVAILPK